MKSACSGKKITVDEIENIKSLLANGFDILEICRRSGRSYTSVVKIRDGFYDFCLDAQGTRKGKAPAANIASDADVTTADAILSLEDEIASTLMFMDKKAAAKASEINAALLKIAEAIDKNTEAQLKANEIAARNSECLTSIKFDARALCKELTPKNTETPNLMSSINPVLNAKATSNAAEGSKETQSGGAEFLKWNEVVQRAAAISDKTTEKVIKRTTATMKGSSIYVSCNDTDRKYLLTHGTALETLRKQASLICGYSVKIGLA